MVYFLVEEEIFDETAMALIVETGSAVELKRMEMQMRKLDGARDAQIRKGTRETQIRKGTRERYAKITVRVGT